MLSTERIFVKEHMATLKDKDFHAYDYVKTLVRHKELEKALDKKSYKDGKKALEDAHPNINVLTCDKSIINTTLSVDAGQFIKDREEVIALRAECDDCLPLDMVTSMCPVDRVHITLMAHAVYKSVLLDNDIFDIEKGGVDIAPVIKKYFASGQLKGVKDSLRPVFNKLLGSDGQYFYGIKTKKSDFEESDLRNFVSAFGASARRESKKVKKNGETITVYSDFNYVDKSDNKKLQVSAFTDLCTVVLDNAKKHTVITPEVAEETK